MIIKQQVITCDKCGYQEIINFPKGESHVETSFKSIGITENPHFKSDCDFKLDLCDECYAGLTEYLKIKHEGE